MKNSFLYPLEKEINAQLDFGIAVLQPLNESQINTNTPAYLWSIGQCLRHLLTYDDYYTPLLKAAIVKAKPNQGQQAYQPGFFGRWINAQIHPKTIKKKLKAIPRHRPHSHENIMVVQNYLAHLETLLLMVRQSENLQLNRPKIKLSIQPLVRLPFGDILQFMVWHNARHLLQIQDIMQHAQLPVTSKYIPEI